jgi:CheY-like chemotaxis protein
LARKILLADDSVTAQNMGRKILADAGYDVVTVNNGSAALKKIADVKPDLIVLDVYMPGYSGLEVCQRVKENPETARTPILLTVGKLEPFKPEEAKRVRADGFIVKPFEASELLSALTRLEDKIVPRSESSKPGRFARTIAVVEEGRYDKTVANEPDSGWKDRIAFPSGKKKKEAESDDVDEAAIYNPVNKDLRTVIERKTEQDARADEAKVDLGALAAQGLPKDVTPEEIAALAAAAAQIKGTVLTAGEPAEQASAVSESAVSQSREAQPVTQSSAATEVAPQARVEEKVAANIEANIAAKTEEAISRAATAEVAIASEAQPTADFSASAASEPVFQSRRADDEPVTMAAAAGGQSTPHWTAVGTALLPEEATISLELEMERASAELATADVAVAPPVPGESEPANAVVEDPVAETVTASALPEEAPASNSVKNFEVASAFLAETAAALPRRAESAEPVAEPPSHASSEVGPAESKAYDGEASGAATAENRIQEITSAPAEPVSAAPVQSEYSSTGEIQQHDAAQLDPSQPSPAHDVHAHEDHAHHDQAHEDHAHENHVQEKSGDAAVVYAEAQAVETPVATESTPEEQPAVAAVSEFVSDQVSTVESIASSPAETGEIPASSDSAQAAEESAQPEAVPHQPAQKETEIAATTAAAWASWRRIRESGTGSSSSSEARANQDQGASSDDSAAMAVAAGAEKSPEEIQSSDSDSSDIANIVDSVLADLRPKIVAEISRKMGKKK